MDASPKEAPAKGSGRTNYRALRPETFHDWVRSNKRIQAVSAGEDPDLVEVDMADYDLPGFTHPIKGQRILQNDNGSKLRIPKRKG